MFSGSYKQNDVEFLLKPIYIQETDILLKEKLIQSGKKHYSEMISKEYAPSKEYLDIFYQTFEINKLKMAKHVLILANYLSSKNPILVSLVRAGTPVGVLLKRTLEEVFNKKASHYSISIIRDRGIDENAIKYILEHGKDEDIVFIDGWTGKGIISKELISSINNFNEKYKTNISSKLYVLSDISGKADISATSEDYLIPSSILNSTVSGLVSRSILNKEYINENDFHGCRFYDELKNDDLSLWFVDEIMKIIKELPHENLELDNSDKKDLEKISELFIKDTMMRYNVKNINYVKPGIGETTRVLLRRVPDKILVKSINLPEVKHLVVLSKEKNVSIEEDENMPYKAVGIISNLER